MGGPPLYPSKIKVLVRGPPETQPELATSNPQSRDGMAQCARDDRIVNASQIGLFSSALLVLERRRWVGSVQNFSQCAGRPATSSRWKSDAMKE